MKPIKSINGTMSTVFTLGLHADLQLRLYAEIVKVPVAKILLEATDLSDWKKSIDTESDVARRIMASEQTARLAEKDRERDKLVTAIFEEIRQASKSPIAARAESGRKLLLVINPYKGLQRESLGEETAHITGLLTDLAKLQTDVNQLGLQPVITLLKTANTAFFDIRTTRAQSKAADALPTGAAIRARNDATMTAIFRHIEAAYLTAANDPDRKIPSDLIDRLNQIIAETKTTHNESRAQKQAAFEAGRGGKAKREEEKAKKEEQKAKTLEEYKAQLQPLFAEFESAKGLPAGSLVFTGSFIGSGTRRHYELAVKGQETKLWVSIKGGKLTEEEAPKRK